jgi:hypothetical protein
MRYCVWLCKSYPAKTTKKCKNVLSFWSARTLYRLHRGGHVNALEELSCMVVASNIWLSPLWRHQESLKIFYVGTINHYLWHLSLFIQAHAASNGQAEGKRIASLSSLSASKEKQTLSSLVSSYALYSGIVLLSKAEGPDFFQSHKYIQTE